MDGILVRALFCLRQTAGWSPPPTCHMSQLAHVTLHYQGFSLTTTLFQWLLAVALPFVSISLSSGTIYLPAVHLFAVDGPSS